MIFSRTHWISALFRRARQAGPAGFARDAPRRPSTSARVRQLAETAGVELPPPLKPGELVSFKLLPDGRLEIEGAGRVIIIAKERDIPRGFDRQGALTAEDLIELYIGPRVMRFGPLPTGVPFYPRTIILADGSRGVAFTEAGR